MGNIKITAMIECEIELPDWLREAFNRKTAVAPRNGEQPAVAKPPKIRTIIDDVCEYIEAGGVHGRTRTDISRKFHHRLPTKFDKAAMFKALPVLIVSPIKLPKDSQGRNGGAEIWLHSFHKRKRIERDGLWGMV